MNHKLLWVDKKKTYHSTWTSFLFGFGFGTSRNCRKRRPGHTAYERRWRPHLEVDQLVFCLVSLFTNWQFTNYHSTWTSSPFGFIDSQTLMVDKKKKYHWTSGDCRERRPGHTAYERRWCPHLEVERLYLVWSWHSQFTNSSGWIKKECCPKEIWASLT